MKARFDKDGKFQALIEEPQPVKGHGFIFDVQSNGSSDEVVVEVDSDTADKIRKNPEKTTLNKGKVKVDK